MVVSIIIDNEYKDVLEKQALSNDMIPDNYCIKIITDKLNGMGDNYDLGDFSYSKKTQTYFNVSVPVDEKMYSVLHELHLKYSAMPDEIMEYIVENELKSIQG